MVAGIYWNENDLARITGYCQNDVRAIVQVMCRFKGLELMKDDQIEIVKG